MYRIPVINQSTLFEDINRNALVHGKLEILDPVSNNQLTIWSYTDDQYTVMANPVILDIEGRVPQTVFCDRIVYVRVYAFKGNDERNQPIYEFVRDFYAGENENAESREYIIGIESLKDLDPSVNSSVNVLGYFNAYDCPLRTYYWDAQCSQDADNGYIVASDVSDTGRWILVFSGEYLPSNYYGVYPGHTANINALLSYIDYVGTALTKTAPGVWFVPGKYSDSTVALITNKKLLIDNTSSFTYESITSNDDIKIVGGETDHCITDLYGVKTARSSWYRTLQGFLDSGAKELIFDENINVTQAPVLTKNTSLHNVHLVNNTNMYAGWMGFNNFMLTLDRCTVDDHLFYPSTSRIFFQNMLVTDRYFYAPTVQNMDISRINCDDFNFNLCNFDNAAIYLKWKYQKGVTDIDMQGRLVSDIDFAPSLIGLHNCRFNTLTLNDSRKSVFLENCQGTIRSANVKTLTINKCRLTIDIDVTLNGGILDIVDSELSGSGTFIAGNAYALNIERSNVSQNITFPYITNPASQYYDIIIDNSNVTGTIEVKKLTMTNSKAGTVKIYGSVGSSMPVIGNVKLENNVIDDFGFFTVTNYESIISSCVFVQTRIVNNTFNNSFTCPYYVTDSESKKYEFIYRTGAHDFLYRGNNGQCPIDSTQLVTKMPYTDGAYQDANEHTWNLELKHTFRMFMPGERLILGTALGAKMVEFFTTYGTSTEAVAPVDYGLFHAGSQDNSDNDYFLMCLATNYPALDNTMITFINSTVGV